MIQNVAVLIGMLVLSMVCQSPARGDNLPDRGLERFVVQSEQSGVGYEVVLARSAITGDSDKPLPLLVVLDGFLLGMTAIETARLLTSAGEIEPIVIATISADGPFALRTARRGPDFSADVEDFRSQSSIKGILPQLDAAGVKPEQAFGHSDGYRTLLSKILLPEITRRVAVDGDHQALFGHSAAGAFVLEALLVGDLPFQTYIAGEPGTFMLFGTESALLKQAAQHPSLPGQRLLYADSSDTMSSSSKHLFESEELLKSMRKDLGLQVEARRYEGETHTTMIPLFIKDSLLALYGTGQTYSKSFAQRMGIDD